MKREIRIEGAARQHNVYIFPLGRARFAGTIVRRPGGFHALVGNVVKWFTCPHAAEQYIADKAAQVVA